MSARLASPLAGRRIAVTRAADQAAELLALLRTRGAEPLPCATIEIVGPLDGYIALDDAVRSLDRYDWIAFTSQNAVKAVADRMAALGCSLPEHVQIAAVGEATARAATGRVGRVHFVPSTARAESLATELSNVAGRQLLFPRGELAGEALATVLRARGARVDEVIAYRTVSGTGARQLARLVRRGDVDAILFLSASSVRHFLDALGEHGGPATMTGRAPAIVCIGPETAQAARELGLTVGAVAAEQTATGIVDALEQWFGGESDGAGG